MNYRESLNFVLNNNIRPVDVMIADGLSDIECSDEKFETYCSLVKEVWIKYDEAKLEDVCEALIMLYQNKRTITYETLCRKYLLNL